MVSLPFGFTFVICVMRFAFYVYDSRFTFFVLSFAFWLKTDYAGWMTLSTIP
ncbi:hypothetical protein JOC55_001339 [Paenibacillus sacheonensis]|nr:hypothetical protein [Paenibacillus sacheonensis]